MTVDGGVSLAPERSATTSTSSVERNSTLNATVASPAVAASDVVVQSPWIGDVEAALIAVLLSAVVVGTLLGNASVILAVTVYDKMRTLSNALIASLASADLLVAIVVMPISLQVHAPHSRTSAAGWVK